MNQKNKLQLQKVLVFAVEMAGSLEEIARILDVRLATVKSWYHGHTHPRTESLLRLAELATGENNLISMLGGRRATTALKNLWSQK
ncbi:MAG: hypothetical protein HYW48_07270 [Deltaproteobacteria bacterium]|nr:hypothetical protein [Deltaproteobacteria bacterium]